MIEERCGLMQSVIWTSRFGQTTEVAGESNEGTVFNPRSGFVRVMNELVGDIAERIVYRYHFLACLRRIFLKLIPL